MVKPPGLDKSADAFPPRRSSEMQSTPIEAIGHIGERKVSWLHKGLEKITTFVLALLGRGRGPEPLYWEARLELLSQKLFGDDPARKTTERSAKLLALDQTIGFKAEESKITPDKKVARSLEKEAKALRSELDKIESELDKIESYYKKQNR